MTVESQQPSPWHNGTIVRLNLAAGFGYVQEPQHGTFIFLVGRALRHADAHRLAVGKAVRFRLSGNGRVDELSPE
jgi:cold shock CspA family protein